MYAISTKFNAIISTYLNTYYRIMEQIYAKHTASISELKASPTKLLNQAKGEAIAILNHNTPSAYLISAKKYTELLEAADDYLLANEVGKRLNDRANLIPVNIDDL
jgi:antitoxin StbD